MVLVSCEALDSDAPGLAGQLLCRATTLPGCTFLTAQLLRPRWIHHLAMIFNTLSKRRVPDGLVGNWIGPLHHDLKVRNDPNNPIYRVEPVEAGDPLEWSSGHKYVERQDM